MGTLFGYQLKVLREKKGLKQEELANILGIEKDVYCGFENGDCFPKHKSIYKKIAKFFDVTERYLFKRKDEEEFPPIAQIPNREETRKHAVRLIDDIREFYYDPEISWDDKYCLRFAIQGVFRDYYYKRMERRKAQNEKILETEINNHTETDFYD